MRLKGKVAIITGAANGIGKQIAETYAREGAKVVIADRNAAEAELVAKTIQGNGFEALAVSMDVTEEEQVEAGVNTTLKAFGAIDILVSNAGYQHISSLEKLSYREWKELIAVHLDGAFLTTRACLKSMYAREKGGTIIYMGSTHSKDASILKAPYVTAKHGLIGLCKVVAKEGANYNVRANVICPGSVRTALVEKQIPEQAKILGMSADEVIKNVILKNTVDNQFTTTMDVAEVALFFASFPSNALTGQSLVVSHGWHMQ